MINYDSILSAFDGKPTLLQWLKMVKKALDESVLKDITVSQDGANVIFTFNFEDGTSISTPAVTLPKGDTDAKGGKLYVHNIEIRRTSGYSIPIFTCQILNSRATQLELTDFQDHRNVGCIVNAKMNGVNESIVPPTTYIAWNQIDILTESNIPIKVAITFEQTYPFKDGEYTVFEFNLTDGNTSYSDTVTEL